jgi:hypothetical protein
MWLRLSGARIALIMTQAGEMSIAEDSVCLLVAECLKQIFAAAEKRKAVQIMTDNEIVKALEYCGCAECMAIIDLINRQKAEIERLRKDNEYILMQHRFQRRPGGDCWNDVIEKAKAEAIKEFAERLKEKAWNGMWEIIAHVDVDDIDRIAKEMTEETVNV